MPNDIKHDTGCRCHPCVTAAAMQTRQHKEKPVTDQITFEEFHITIKVSKDLPPEQRRKLQRALRGASDQILAYVEYNILPAEMVDSNVATCKISQ